MKIYLLYPRVFAMTFPPLGILYIAGALEKSGCQVKIKDLLPGINYNKTILEIKDYEPDLIGITINTPQFALASELITEIKHNIREAKIVCGGVHSTIFPKEMIEDLGADFVVYGEGEDTIIELCNAIKNHKDLKNIKGIAYKNKKDSEAIINPPRNLIENIDLIPFPARHLVDFSYYLRPPGIMRGLWMKRGTTIMATRGCPAGCTFCGSKVLFGRKVRKRSVVNVIEEIKLLKKSYDIDGLYFVDDTLTADKKWLFEFLQAFRNLNYDLTWGCQSRACNIDEEIIREFKKSGCKQLEFGVESGSQKVLNNLKKGITVPQIINAFDIAKKHKIRRLATFMVGNPHETYEDILMTQKLAKRIRPDFATFFYTTPFPGTELYDYAKRNSYLKTERFSEYNVRNPGILEINFKSEELIKIRRRLQNCFIWKNIWSYFKNPAYVFNLFMFLIKNIKALSISLRTFMRTKNFDDITFSLFVNAK